jgi:hypothetical protein
VIGGRDLLSAASQAIEFLILEIWLLDGSTGLSLAPASAMRKRWPHAWILDKLNRISFGMESRCMDVELGISRMTRRGSVTTS